MSAPKRQLDDQDPDYASPGPSQAKQQKLYEENAGSLSALARANTAKKITAIVEKEFTKEIDTKEKEALEIQNRLHAALKTLHLLRYVVITDFYNRKQCQAPQAPETKQSRIHPAIKRLIGKAPRRQKSTLEDPGPSSSEDSRYIPELHEKDVAVTIKIEPETQSELSNFEGRLGEVFKNENIVREQKLSVQTKKSVDEHNDAPPMKVPRYIPPRSNVLEIASPARGVHHKVRKRIVVGNISKWIPPDWREDAASHKWMMYVRGGKDQADISDFVSKVRFFLHPSYQPNDVVEVTSPPFHLSRRGWGEFPLRVQLHFKNILNKPMDIIHYLKLDRTYTGLQTLGSETVVDIWIHTTDPHNFSKSLDFGLPSQDKSIGKEVDMSIVKQEHQETETETDYPDNLKVTAIKTENMESNEQTVSENNCSVKIDHDYVCNERLVKNESFEVVHCLESNVTIKHSPLRNISSNAEIGMNIKTEEEDSQLFGESNSCTVNPAENLQANDESCNVPEIFVNSKESDENVPERNIKLVESISKSTITLETESVALEKPAKVMEITRKPSKEASQIESTEVEKNLLKNVQNGDVPGLPIKLVKCKDKIFYMADIGKLPNNKVDLAKIAASSVVKNILASKGLSPKVMIQGNVNPALNKIISVKNPSNESTQDKIKVKNVAAQNSAKTLESETKQESIATIPSILLENSLSQGLSTQGKGASGATSTSTKNAVFLKNSVQRIDMQKLASTLKLIPSKGEPLNITIPPAFEPTKRKQFLVLKNNRLIPMNTNNASSLAALLNPKQDKAVPKLIEKNVLTNLLETKKDSFLMDGNKLSLLNANSAKLRGNVASVTPSVSLLKKSVGNNTTKLDSANQNKPPKILKINPSNSLLLNSNTNLIPTLQIATPLPALQVPGIQQKSAAQLKLKQLPKSVKLEDLVSKPVKTKIVLCRDKHKILSKREAYEDVLRSIDSVHISDMLGTLNYIMKRIPLITKDAADPDYRRMHPYSCSTEDEFFGYNIGKQRAHEWYRAKTVRSLLRKKGFDDDKLWSVKEILIWARLHGYTPAKSCFEIGTASKTMKKLPNSSNAPVSSCTEPTQLNEWLENHKDSTDPNDDSDIEVDVVQISEPKIKTEVKQEPVDLTEDSIVLEVSDDLESSCAFVNETAREVGVKLQREEIYPGVMHCAAGRMILQAVQCLMDDVMRRSLAKAWERNSNKCPETIVVDDVREALLSRDEFDVFTNAGLGSQQDAG